MLLKAAQDNIMPRLKSILGYAILIGAVLLIFWVTQRIDVPNVALRRTMLSSILLIGLICALYFNAPRRLPAIDKDEIEAWEPLINRGQTKFLFDFVFSGFKWFVPVLVIGLICDSFYETSMVNNLGIYGAIGLAWLFNFYLSGVRFWRAAEIAYRSRSI